MQIRKILKIQQIRLAACAAQPERGVSSDCANRFKKPRGQTKVCPYIYGGYCHTPEGAPGRACRLRGTARTRRFERLRKQIQKAEGQTKVCPYVCGGYCHTPEGAPGRACRLSGIARTRRFERLRKQIQKAEGRGCLPLPSAFWSTCADSNRGSPESESDVLSSCTTGRYCFPHNLTRNF